MHELLSHRDGEATALARKHLESCEPCRNELERLHRIRAELKALPGYTPPRDQWPRIVAEVRRRRRRRWWTAGTAGLAAAAALAGIILLRGGGPAVNGTVVPAEEAWVAEATSGDLGPFIRRSQELEGMLQTYSLQYRVYNAPTAIAVSALEDRIIILDRMLHESRQVGVDRRVLVNLWDERTATLETLVGIQLGEGRPVDRPASAPGGVWR
jgi:predicted anti-sigma-YlaC factor YlaD